MKSLRQLYDWVLSWADKPSGPKVLGFMSAAEASFFPIPPDVLLIPLSLGKGIIHLLSPLFVVLDQLLVQRLGMELDCGFGGQIVVIFQVLLNFS